MSKSAVKISLDLLSNPLCEQDQDFLNMVTALDTAMKRMDAFNQEKVSGVSPAFSRLLCGWSAYVESLMGLVFSLAAFKPSEARVLQALGALSQPCLSPGCFPWFTHRESCARLQPLSLAIVAHPASPRSRAAVGKREDT